MSSSSSSSSNSGSGGFGITLHHEGQNDQNSIAPSPFGGRGNPNEQVVQKTKDQQGTINDDDIKNKKP